MKPRIDDREDESRRMLRSFFFFSFLGIFCDEEEKVSVFFCVFGEVLGIK